MKNRVLVKMSAVLLLFAILAAGAAGCGKKEKEKDAETKQQEEAAPAEDIKEEMEEGFSEGDGDAFTEGEEEDLLVDEDGNPLSEEDIAGMDGEPVDDMPVLMEEFESVEELREATSIPIEEVTALPFTPVNTLYLVYDNGMYEIQYQDASGDQVSLRKSEDAEDTSVIPGLYEAQETLQAAGRDVVIYSVEGAFYLAAWTDGTYGYSLMIDSGTSPEGMAVMVESVR